MGTAADSVPKPDLHALELEQHQHEHDVPTTSEIDGELVACALLPVWRHSTALTPHLNRFSGNAGTLSICEAQLEGLYARLQAEQMLGLRLGGLQVSYAT